MGINLLEGRKNLFKKGCEIRMARTARSRSSLNLYHIIVRGINKQDIFLDNQDKRKFLKELIITKEKFNFKIYAYVIMPNHVHLILKEQDDSISKIMHRIQLCYSEYLNSKYERVGHVFQGRFNSKSVEDVEYLKCAIRYVHLNPDKAGIGKYNNYLWSSYRSYTKENKSKLVDTEDILELFREDRNPRKKFEEYHKEKSKYQYNKEDTEFELLNKIDDSTLIRIIKENMDLNAIYDIQKLNNKYRDDILKQLIAIKGTTTKQISRVTGISTRIIEEIKRKNSNKK